MKLKMTITIVTGCLCVALHCHAQTAAREAFLTTADDFLKHCGPLDPNLSPDMKTIMEGARESDIPLCNMYVFGIFEGIELYDTIAVQHSKNPIKPDDSICIIGGISTDHLRQVVVRYIQADPEIAKQKDRTDTITLLALEKAFPCKAASQ